METAIYGRVSSEEQAQEGYSIRGQVEKLKSYISAKSWSVFDVYLDEGISGKNITERPAINRMLDDIKAGHIKNVLIFKLDRLTRSVADLMYLIDLFKAHGCAFNSLSESIDTSSASGRMFLKMIGIFAEFERENIGERVRLGKERKAREGFSTSASHVSYGYDRDVGEKVQRINKEEAAVVRRMYDMYVNQNFSLSGIARTLNVEKIPSKYGSIWNAAKIKSTLLNCNYMGYVRYCQDDPERHFEAEGKHEAIVSEGIYQQAKTMLDKIKRTAPTKPPSDKNYFAGLLVCGVCGRKLITHTYSHANKQGERLTLYGFQCAGLPVRACDSKTIMTNKLETALIEYFSTLDITPDIEQEEKAAEEKRALAARLEMLQGKLALLDAKEKETLDSYIEDTATLSEYRGVKVKLDSERARITAEIERITPTDERNWQEGAASIEQIVSMFRAEWGSYSDKQKRQFMVTHIKRITVINEPKPGNKRQGIYRIVGVEYAAD